MLKFELSEQMVAVIGEALGGHTYRLAAPVIAEIQRQIEAQQPKSNGKLSSAKERKLSAEG